MALPYLKLPPEKSLLIIDECIVIGYRIKDQIIEEYSQNKSSVNDEKVSAWQLLANKWANESIEKLGSVFVSQKELYNFRDAQVPFGATSENIQWFSIIAQMQARINRLNEYDAYIHQRFNVQVEFIGRDKIVQQGANGKIEIKN